MLADTEGASRCERLIAAAKLSGHRTPCLGTLENAGSRYGCAGRSPQTSEPHVDIADHVPKGQSRLVTREESLRSETEDAQPNRVVRPFFDRWVLGDVGNWATAFDGKHAGQGVPYPQA